MDVAPGCKGPDSLVGRFRRVRCAVSFGVLLSRLKLLLLALLWRSHSLSRLHCCEGDGFVARGCQGRDFPAWSLWLSCTVSSGALGRLALLESWVCWAGLMEGVAL